MGRKNWRSKKRHRTKIKINLKSRDIVSVNILILPTLELIAQIASFLTRKRYKYIIVHIDYTS